MTSSDPDIRRMVESNALVLTEGNVALIDSLEGGANFPPATLVTKFATRAGIDELALIFDATLREIVRLVV